MLDYTGALDYGYGEEIAGIAIRGLVAIPMLPMLHFKIGGIGARNQRIASLNRLQSGGIFWISWWQGFLGIVHSFHLIILFHYVGYVNTIRFLVEKVCRKHQADHGKGYQGPTQNRVYFEAPEKR